MTFVKLSLSDLFSDTGLLPAFRPNFENNYYEYESIAK